MLIQKKEKGIKVLEKVLVRSVNLHLKCYQK